MVEISRKRLSRAVLGSTLDLTGRTKTLKAQVAQLVEHVTENHGVGGSIPPLGTIIFNDLANASMTPERRLREFCGTRLCSEPRKTTSSGRLPSRSHTRFGRLDQPRQLGRRVVRRDPPGAMPEQILAILKAHAGRPQPAAERVLQVVNADMRQDQPVSAPASKPSVSMRSIGPALVGEHVRWMMPAPRLDDRSRDAVENDQPLLAVLHARARNDEDRTFQVRARRPPNPSADCRSRASRQPVLTANSAICRKMSRAARETAAPARPNSADRAAACRCPASSLIFGAASSQVRPCSSIHSAAARLRMRRTILQTVVDGADGLALLGAAAAIQG